MPTNCKNCGAPLTGCECEYCGTRYEFPERIILYADDEPVVVIEDEEYYMPNMETFADALCRLSRSAGISLNDVRREVGLPEIEDKPSPIRRPTPIPGYITH